MPKETKGQIKTMVIAGVISGLTVALVIGLVKSCREFAIDTIIKGYQYLSKTIEIPNYLFILFCIITIAGIIFLLIYLRWKFPKHLEIIEATYGSVNNCIDVVDVLNYHKNNNRINFRVKNSMFGSNDPAPKVSKVLTVRYKVKGKEYTKKIKEGSIARIP